VEILVTMMNNVINFFFDFGDYDVIFLFYLFRLTADVDRNLLML